MRATGQLPRRREKWGQAPFFRDLRTRHHGLQLKNEARPQFSLAPSPTPFGTIAGFRAHRRVPKLPPIHLEFRAPERLPRLSGLRNFRHSRYGMPSIKVKENEPFDVALRRFKRSCEKAGVLAEVRRREFYEKPTWVRKRKAAAAVKRHQKKLARESRRQQRMY